MGQSRARGFTLVELLVVIAIIGTLVGLLLPAVQSSREASRTAQCSFQLAELSKAMQMYEKSNESYPGYVDELGLAGVSTKSATWAVYLLPHIEQNALWETWNNPGGTGKLARVASFICPSSPSTSDDAPALSYVANTGWIGREPEDVCDHITENIANGVFFDRTRGGNDQRDLKPCNCDCCYCPDAKLRMTFAYVQVGDGTTATMMFSERVRQVPWGSVSNDAIDRKWNHGFCWAQSEDVAEGIANNDARQYWRINGFQGRQRLLRAWCSDVQGRVPRRATIRAG